MPATIGIPTKLQKLGAVCEKLRLVYWLYNNDGNGCGPIQGIPITFFGDWTMDEFYCDGVNIIPSSVAGSYSNWNDNFNYWTGALNPLSLHHWDWINAGRPCFRVMSTITCDDTEYGDFKLTAVNTVRPAIDGEQYLIQPQAIVGEEVEVLACREKDKQGNVTKKFYDKSGDPIESLLDYYASKNDQITVADTGAIPFTAANISKFYSEEDLCDCLKDCLHEYAHIDDTPPCVVETCENACIYSSVLQEDETEEVVQFMTGVSAVTLWGQDGLLKSRTLVEGQFQEDSSANVYIDQDTLPEGWWKDETCTGIQPEGPPAECPQGQKFPVNIGGGYVIPYDNSVMLPGGLPNPLITGDPPFAHLKNGENYEFTFFDFAGNVVYVWQQTADPYFNNLAQTFDLPGCTIESVCANHTSPKGCSPAHVANLDAHGVYDPPSYPADIQNNLSNPGPEEVWATAWHIVCGGCAPEIASVRITNANNPDWIGIERQFIPRKLPDILGFMVLPDDCSPAVYVDCDQNVLNPQPACKPLPWNECCDAQDNKQTAVETFRVCWFIDGDINNCADGNVLQTFAKQVDCYIDGSFDSSETNYFEVDGTTPFDPDSLAETAIAVPCRIDDEGNILICHPKCYEYTVPVIVKPIKIVKSIRTLTAVIKKSLVRKVVAEKAEPDVAIQRSVAPGEEPAALEYTPGTTLRVTECCLCGSSEVVQTIYEIQQDDLSWLEVDGPFELGADSLWVEKPCDPALDCPKEDLVDLGACTIGTLTDLIEQFKTVKSDGIEDANYDGAIAITTGRPLPTVPWALIDNRFPPNDGSVVVIGGDTFQEFSDNATAAGYTQFIEGEIHYLCPCPPGLENAGDYFVTADGNTVTKPACTPLTELASAPEKVALEELCALRVGLCPEDITALACAIKDKLSECPVCPELVTGFLTDVNDGSVLDLPFEALGSVQEWTQNITVDNPDCLSDEVELCVTIDHEAGVGGHTGFLVIASAGIFTAKSASNSIPGFFSNPGTNIISIGHNQELGNARNLRWVKLTVSKADLIAGISIQSGTFGSTNATSFDKMHSINYEITAGKDNCDGC